MKIEKEKKVFKVTFDALMNEKEFIFAKDEEEAERVAMAVYAHRKIISIERIELCG